MYTDGILDYILHVDVLKRVHKMLIFFKDEKTKDLRPQNKQNKSRLLCRSRKGAMHQKLHEDT